ncbi:thioredoxin domain-containing protein [Heyndrickxia ginsengihumi]|uniref:thioredoxin domain-containing protein n=1 Tax=Heyndrickxia ginsengihumi TaxID=363870 RepID=UPI003D19AB69
MSTFKKPNRLINEKSPYLLQHAHNPVDWFPWGEEAFEKAKQENKPVFVSIGYSTCHWCHIMEKESFEDTQVAHLLNQYFISIKVDREERPDIDSIYMNVCQMLTGQGGWPLNVFLTPEQKPFYAGTYFPKLSMYGRPGLIDILNHLHKKYEEDQQRIVEIADKITSSLNERSKLARGAGIHEDILHQAFHSLQHSYDSQYGGFGNAPKFPMPHQFMFLLRYFHWTNNQYAYEIAENTLTSIINGGIHDHLGGGFARYSTDREWLVPHFEKMLHDQALMLYALTEMYEISHEQKWKAVGGEILAFIKREMTSEYGAFYSALDADSEGIEGKYYIWTKDEIDHILEEKEAKIFCKVYHITDIGNFEGENILHKIHTKLNNVANDLNMSVAEVEMIIQNAKNKLLHEREKRVHPHLDDKILTSWNGLMIAALAKASKVFNDTAYLQAAKQAMKFIEEQLWKDKRLYARFRDGEIKYPAYIDDYAFLMWAYIELYEADHQTTYIEKAIEISNILLSTFWDDENGGFYFTNQENETLILGEKQGFDDALPSGNSVAALMLWKLAKICGNAELFQKVDEIITSFQDDIEQYPSSFLFMLQGLMGRVIGGKEVVVSGYSEAQRQQLEARFYSCFRPFDVFIDASPNNQVHFWSDKIDNNHPFVLYLCEHFSCQMPVYNLDHSLQLL